ncbi:hypothetical protein M3Y97_00556200 [Aphelenchoides bicaudatus]|nr:hypothetical protein M3Y97_00556200 [Aphelenchoides bicaudatus]
MDISVNLDSFTLLEAGPLKYSENFLHHSVYAQPLRKRLKKSRLKWQRVTRLLVGNSKTDGLTRPETAALLHPVMRHLGKMYIRRRRLKLNMSFAQKSVRRSRRSRILPSFRPFMCQRCSLSSFSLSVILKHECRRRKYKAYSFDELEKAASLGARSGVRNAMSAIEMTEQPNKVRLPPPVKSRIPEKLENTLPIRRNQKVPDEFKESSSTVEMIQKENEAVQLVDCLEGSHLASFCLNCRRSFSLPSDFKKHEDDCKNANELKFLVKNFHHFPSAGVELPDGDADTLISMFCWSCSRTDFRDSNAFHEHIMHCY